MATFKINTKEVERKLLNLESKADIAIKMYAQQGATKFENYAKINKRWIDRTGHARQRLVGYVEKLSQSVRIYIAHGVDYGIYLELAHEKRFAILQETVNNNSKEILEGYTNMIGKMRV